MDHSNLDQPALGRIYLWLLGIAFATLTALSIHGSSVVMWSIVFHEEQTASALLSSKPRELRSDEWLVCTPSILAQARHQPPFPIENPALGAGRSPMLMNLPTQHYSTFFRPQLWGYFLFDVEHGFAWDWNIKIFGLLAAMFVLFRRLTDGDFWLSLLGSIWVYASSYLQWWFSCPPMLPEMLASWALAIWCILRLLDGPSWRTALPLTTGLVFAAVNFSLSMYPPYQIPLVYLGLAILGGWLWQQTLEGGGPQWRKAAGWLVAGGASVVLVVVPFYLELIPTLHLVQNTSYPGARRTVGGALRFTQLFSGFSEPLISAENFPEKLENAGNASNFIPLWLAAGGWLILATIVGGPFRRRLLWPLFAMLLGLALFALCPFPTWVGRISLLSLSTEARLILPIGVGGIFLCVLALREATKIPRLALLPRLVVLAFVSGSAIAVLLSSATESPQFFTLTRLTIAASLALGLSALYLWPMPRTFALVLLAVLLPPALVVNPVTQGLGPLTDTSALPVIDEIRRADPDARWLAFDGANLSAFLMSAGVQVLSGAKTLPDLDLYRELDPTGRHLEIYNRYSLGLFQASPDPSTVEFKLFNFCAHQVAINPGHPALRRRQVRYFVFPKPLQDPAAVGLQAFRSVPERRLWIYKLHEA